MIDKSFPIPDGIIMIDAGGNILNYMSEFNKCYVLIIEHNRNVESIPDNLIDVLSIRPYHDASVYPPRDIFVKMPDFRHTFEGVIHPGVYFLDVDDDFIEGYWWDEITHVLEIMKIAGKIKGWG